MSDAEWQAVIAAEWRGIMERADAKRRRERAIARMARFRRALENVEPGRKYRLQ